jgi:hypothetical protein
MASGPAGTRDRRRQEADVVCDGDAERRRRQARRRTHHD